METSRVTSLFISERVEANTVVDYHPIEYCENTISYVHTCTNIMHTNNMFFFSFRSAVPVVSVQVEERRLRNVPFLHCRNGGPGLLRVRPADQQSAGGARRAAQQDAHPCQRRRVRADQASDGRRRRDTEKQMVCWDIRRKSPILTTTRYISN